MTQPVVAILNSSGAEILTTAVNIGVSVSPSKVFAKHTLEDSTVVVDDEYDNPTLVTMRMILDPSDYVNVYQEIKSLYESITEFTIQTKVDSYQSMYLEAIPHEMDPAMYDTISINLEFTEQIIVSTDVDTLAQSDVASPADSDTANSGAKSTTQDDGTVLSRLFDKVF